MIDADNCMQTHVRKLVVENTRLYLGTTRDGTELYTIDGELNGMRGETTLKVSNTRVADVTEDGWLRTLATGHDTVTVSVPVTVTGGGTYTMSRNFRLRVITTNTRLGHFELVNDASTLQAGDSLMIVATKDDKSYAISANDAKMGGKDAFEVRIGENGTIDDDDVPDDATTITLKGTAGAWNLHTGNDTYFYTSAKKPDSSTFDFSSIMNMGNKDEEGTESGSEKGNSEKGSTGLPDMFGGSDSNKLRNDTIVGVLGDSTMVKIAIAAEGLATITFRGDSIMTSRLSSACSAARALKMNLAVASQPVVLVTSTSAPLKVWTSQCRPSRSIIPTPSRVSCLRSTASWRPKTKWSTTTT